MRWITLDRGMEVWMHRGVATAWQRDSQTARSQKQEARSQKRPNSETVNKEQKTLRNEL